ncbi:putative MFS transporter [Coniochaeta sp. PMI_546]|nr:putative MFS transporter [Coniochaeta sp. PMI_546]
MAEKDAQVSEPAPAEQTDLAPPQAPLPVHSIFPRWQRIIYVYIASLAAFASPVSSSIYYPAMSSLAHDLNTSLTNISFTITAYMIFQGVAPTIVGGFSDRVGRRPAYFLSFTVFMGANVGLALQSNYAALLVLRCLQSCGSSGTVALSSAVVSDVATRQERGSYIGLAALGSSMGPALGPLIGGLLDHFLGWRAIFWFLTIFGGIMLLVFLVFIPETCRNVVGNGSLPPQWWNRPLIELVRLRKSSSSSAPVITTERSTRKRPGLLSTIPIILDKESFLSMFFSGIIYTGYYIILTGLPQQLESTYNYNSIQVGLCYLPIGFGPMIIRPVIGRIMDSNFRRHARRQGVEILQDRQQSIDGFPIERARLETSLVMVYLSSAAIIPYGWTMSLDHPPLPAALVLLFVLGVCLSAAFQPLTALLVDINPRSPAAATAAHQFVRCVLGAAGVAVVNPMLNGIGRGWTSTLIALVWVVFSACWWAVIYWGPKWRKQKGDRE